MTNMFVGNLGSRRSQTLNQIGVCNSTLASVETILVETMALKKTI